MTVFSRASKKKTESLIRKLGITSPGLVITDDIDKKSAERTVDALAKNTLVFVPQSMKSVTEGKPVIAVAYGSRLRMAEDGVYTDNLSPSTFFYCTDDDIAELAYALSVTFQKDLTLLRAWKAESEETVHVSTEEEAIAVLRKLESREKTVVYYLAGEYGDARRLSSAFSSYDYAVINKDAIGCRKFEKALERIIFSPFVHRLSQVFMNTEDTICVNMYEENLRTIRIVLGGDVI